MRSYCLMDTEFQFCKRRVLEKDGGGGCTITRMYFITSNCTLKNSKMCILSQFKTFFKLFKSHNSCQKYVPYKYNVYLPV